MKLFRPRCPTRSRVAERSSSRNTSFDEEAEGKETSNILSLKEFLTDLTRRVQAIIVIGELGRSEYIFQQVKDAVPDLLRDCVVRPKEKTSVLRGALISTISRSSINRDVHRWDARLALSKKLSG